MLRAVNELLGMPTFVCNANETSQPGDSTIYINVSGMSAANYDITGANGTLTITSKAITVVTNHDTVTYDGLDHTVAGFETLSFDVNGTAFTVSGLEAAKRIKKVSPKTKIIIVTSMPEVSYIKRAREIGVESFWYKEASREPILSVMDRTMAGESVYPDSAPVLTLGNAKSVEFTPKELEVLREMTMGLTNSAIAEKLFIDVTTVKSHVTHMLQKTGFQNRTELAIQARVSGLVIGEPEEETEKKR